jgi:hypothetical protein
MSSLSFKNRASNYLRNMQIKAKTKFLHSIGAITDAEVRAEREKADMNRSNYYKNISRRGATNVWENAKKRGKTYTERKYGPEFIHNGKRYSAWVGDRASDPTKIYSNREPDMRSRYELKNGYKGQRLHGSETYIMNKQDTNATNNFNAKELAQKKAPGGMAVWGGRKGKTRRNRKNRRGTRKN